MNRTEPAAFTRITLGIPANSTELAPRILLAEDEESLVELLRYNLEAEGWEVDVAMRGDDAETALLENPPDLLLLDWMLPGLSGIELCRRLRQRESTRALPIVMLTARGEEHERVRGLGSGADDYITKPFSIPEMLARIRALLRRTDWNSGDCLRHGDVEVNLRTRRAICSGRNIELRSREFRLLAFLMRSPGRAFTREQLLDGAWGRDIYVEERTVDVHIGRIRRAFAKAKAAAQAKTQSAGKHLSEKRAENLIRTIHGVGYALNENYARTGKASKPAVTPGS